ncbi:siphovirus Gp157 family protein [Peptoniphilus lacydonensis]|uniref:siphovirus Gp157 family protein n=1 Tax=Peptoniphilus lacydonensis TaxID=1673725 RepID=UPI00290923D3|nr:siphovirus Gp157 family protein [Peptoniphilus lacydonensis]MDU5377366.1 siphovirus Gp157 family protein [Peptoniphilus lacydonensis]MDU5436183.1 siphovirus Gp157 family protein [Peptoniphilus lacydonensis]
MQLYELAEMYLNLKDMDIEEGDLNAALENINDEIETKADNIAKVLRDFDGDIEALKSEEERLAKKRKAIENRQKQLKEYLQNAMLVLDKRKFKTDLFSFNIQKNAPSLKILDESKIPEDYYKIEKKLNKNDLKEAVKKGLFEDAAKLVQTESLRIR